MDYRLTFSNLPERPRSDLPQNPSSEWDVLRPFVEYYNSRFTRSFRPKAFPELDRRNSPQPEVLLFDDSGQMVIERKIVLWPKRYIQQYKLWESFCEVISSNVGSMLADKSYVLETNWTGFPQKKKDAVHAAEAVIEELCKYASQLTDANQISNHTPMDWRFYILPDSDKDDDEVSGIQFRHKMPQSLTESELRVAKAELQGQVRAYYKAAAEKFTTYSHCVRILLLEPYSLLLGPRYQEFEAVVTSVVPLQIDQVWLTEALEIEDGVLVPDYNMVFDRNA